MLLSLSSRGSSGIWDVGCGLWFDTLQKRMRRKHLIVVYRQFYRLSSIVYRPAICEGRRTDQGCGVGIKRKGAGRGMKRNETRNNNVMRTRLSPIVFARQIQHISECIVSTSSTHLYCLLLHYSKLPLANSDREKQQQAHK